MGRTGVARRRPGRPFAAFRQTPWVKRRAVPPVRRGPHRRCAPRRGGPRPRCLGQQRHQGDLRLAAAGVGERGRAGRHGQAGGLGEHAHLAVAQLAVAGHHVNHEVGVRAAEPDHDRRGQRVEHQLLRGAGLHAGRAGDRLRAGVDRDVHVGERGVPATTSHSRTVPSSPPVASTGRPSTERHTPQPTRRVWPLSGSPSGTPRSNGAPPLQDCGASPTRRADSGDSSSSSRHSTAATAGGGTSGLAVTRRHCPIPNAPEREMYPSPARRVRRTPVRWAFPSGLGLPPLTMGLVPPVSAYEIVGNTTRRRQRPTWHAGQPAAGADG
jgi:hypothetical protein